MAGNQDNMITVLLDGDRGIYLPQSFAENFDMGEWHVKAEGAEILRAGPDHEFYWEAWDDVLNYARYTMAKPPRGMKKGKWHLSVGESGDLFAVHEDYVWDD